MEKRKSINCDLNDKEVVSNHLKNIDDLNTWIIYAAEQTDDPDGGLRVLSRLQDLKIDLGNLHQSLDK